MDSAIRERQINPIESKQQMNGVEMQMKTMNFTIVQTMFASSKIYLNHNALPHSIHLYITSPAVDVM